MTSEECIEIIRSRLMDLVNSGKMTARYDQDEVSFYVRDIEMGMRPLLTLRLSDHRPTYQKYIRPDAIPPSGEENTNISIEFYKPKYDEKGKLVRNKVNHGVSLRHDKEPSIDKVVPFIIHSYSYTPELLDLNDIDSIYESMMNWVNSGVNTSYIDPFADTPKQAYPQEKIANIKIKNNKETDGLKDSVIPRYSIINEYNSQNNCNRNRNVVRLTESQLKQIITESVKEILKEHYNLEKYGTWNVVEGTHLPQIAKGLEDWGELSDERLYDDGNHNGYMIFKICDGMGKNQGICAKLMFDNGDSWYKALKKDEIPQDILQDLRTKRFS